MSNLEVALLAREKGIVAIPCRPGTKIPMVRWKVWQTMMPSEEEQRVWFASPDVNAAIITSGMVLFDCDDPAKVELVLAQCGDTPHRVKTPRGGQHLGYRKRKGVVVKNLVRIKDQPIDIRTDGGIEVIHGRTRDGAYQILGALTAVKDLPVARIGWTREKKRRVIRAPENYGTGRVRSPESYCLKIPSVQGQNGSRGLVRVIYVMKNAGRTPGQIFDFVSNVWGPACCRPEWSEKEILHAITRHCGGVP